MREIWWIVIILIAGSGLLVAARPTVPEPSLLTSGRAPAEVRYGRDVRPILADRCFLCHGPDRDTRKAGLRLDERAAAVDPGDDGSPAIVPGDPDRSEVWRRITAHDDDVMPPRDSNKKALTDGEKEIIRRWIEQGAPYEPHWAFQPVRQPPLPTVANSGWSRGDIDRFVLAGLEKAGLTPSDEAPRATLARRVFLDLTGLPPTPDELHAFINDARPGAYEALVDRLLTQEPYRTRLAERLATPWLDQSRYADTSGIHTDGGRSIWPWRDWVLRALRDNMAYDRFVVEQLAGDLLPEPTQDSRVATGFNRNHVTTDEGGVIAEEYLVEYAVDRVSTTGSVFMGLTLGCARCHDHKYDPVTMEDFYGLIAFFNSVDEPGLYSQTPDAQRAYEPFMAVPTAEQTKAMAEVEALLAKLKADREAPSEGDREALEQARTQTASMARWATPRVTAAESTGGATMTIRPDGSVVATGKNPDTDDHILTLPVDAPANALLLEALPDDSTASKRFGRGANGNVVVTGVMVEAGGAMISPMWAWSDVEQDNGDFNATNIIEANDSRGWALDGHRRPGSRTAVVLLDRTLEAGATARITVQYRSIYAKHTLGRLRVRLGSISDTSKLPEASGRWFRIGPFQASREKVFETAFGPDSLTSLDPDGRVAGKGWELTTVMEGSVLSLSAGTHAEYVAREVFSPTARNVAVSLGSDDGIRVFVNAEEQYSKNTERSAQPDQDKATLKHHTGRNVEVYKIVNTGGDGGFAHRQTPTEGAMARPLVAWLIPDDARPASADSAAAEAWRITHSPRYREITARIATEEKRRGEIDASIPRTMIMKELPKPKQTFVLTRGQYDHPDKQRPVQRRVPTFLGSLPPDAPRDRLGLANWLVSKDNPLLARVTVNRVWEMVFGTGIVRTSEDFGLQGEWPSHPELLDHLAAGFQADWDLHGLLRRIVTSATYRQSSRVRPEAEAIDPENRLLASFPRQRLSAEQIRDQALYASGLLVERFGGPSVKPYQPEGLWQEVSMLASNTREYVQSKGDGLYRRSLYTYWKRAMPPPSMLTLDAPTREFCSIRRPATNTPLQALVLWNDPQFVEAARAVASRVLARGGDDAERLEFLHLLCTARPLDEPRRAALAKSLEEFRARFRGDEPAAKSLISVGESPAPTDNPPELAAWTMLANALLSSDSVIVKN